MKIDVSEETLRTHLSAAVDDVLGGYAAKAKITEAVLTALAEVDVYSAIREGIHAVDTSQISRSIAEELQRMTVRSYALVIEGVTVDLICRLRGIESYQQDYQAKREKIAAELRSER